MSGKFTQAYDGEWIRPNKRNYHIICCDCSLVHKIDFRIRDNRVEFKPTRDDKETKVMRKKTGKGCK